MYIHTAANCCEITCRVTPDVLERKCINGI